MSMFYYLLEYKTTQRDDSSNRSDSNQGYGVGFILLLFFMLKMNKCSYSNEKLTLYLCKRKDELLWFFRDSFS